MKNEKWKMKNEKWKMKNQFLSRKLSFGNAVDHLNAV